MSAEFFVKFDDPHWYRDHFRELSDSVRGLKTFQKDDNGIYLLTGTEGVGEKGRWDYDIRIFLQPEAPMMIEISAKPPSIERDLSLFLAALREKTRIRVEDEDGEPSGW